MEELVAYVVAGLPSWCFDADGFLNVYGVLMAVAETEKRFNALLNERYEKGCYPVAG